MNTLWIVFDGEDYELHGNFGGFLFDHKDLNVVIATAKEFAVIHNVKDIVLKDVTDWKKGN